MKRTILLAFGIFLTLACAHSSFGGGDATIFADGFETGNLGLWTATTGSPLEITNYSGVVPELGLNGAYANVSADRMHRNIIGDNGGLEVSGASSLTAWIYDSGETRAYVQALGYTGTGIANGSTTVDGSLAQLLAIGKYTGVSAVGEVYDGTKYQARVLYGSFNGWFNLNGEGAPSRSPGWHKFTIERETDNTTLNFYVDDTLSRTVTGSTAQSWDTITMGFGSGSSPGGTVYDGISVALIPEPSAVALALTGLGIMLCRRRFRK